MEERLKEILTIALTYGVSDIHFLKKETLHIEMRVKGKMRRLKDNPLDEKLFQYLMYRANLDIAKQFEPQTGSFTMTIMDRHLSLRFAIVTSFHYTSGVLRILNNHGHLTVQDLSQDHDVLAWLNSIANYESGLVVFSGPTGSGKTTTLYTLLNGIRNKKIFTLEDPVEVVNENYVQLQINDKQHLSYSEGIKQLLRHDPDIIMIGEIRDSEAALMALRCALTGHLVLTYLHAQSCQSAILRLLDLGVQRVQLLDVLMGMSNQRLIHTQKGTFVSLYEIMDRKEVNHWFAYEKNSPQHITLSMRLQQAQTQGLLDEAQAQALQYGM